MKESKDDSRLQTTYRLQSGAKVSWEAAGTVQLPAHGVKPASLVEQWRNLVKHQTFEFFQQFAMQW